MQAVSDAALVKFELVHRETLERIFHIFKHKSFFRDARESERFYFLAWSKDV